MSANQAANENLARLCCSVVEEHLGQIQQVSRHTLKRHTSDCVMHLRVPSSTAKVIVSELLKKGRLSLSQLTRFTKQRPHLVKMSLTGLMDLDLCTYKEQVEGARGSVFYYSVNPDKILYRMRHQRYLNYALNKHGQLVGDAWMADASARPATLTWSFCLTGTRHLTTNNSLRTTYFQLHIRRHQTPTSKRRQGPASVQGHVRRQGH